MYFTGQILVFFNFQKNIFYTSNSCGLNIFKCISHTYISPGMRIFLGLGLIKRLNDQQTAVSTVLYIYTEQK